MSYRNSSKTFHSIAFSALLFCFSVFLLQACSDSSDAFLNKGKALLREGKPREATEYINKAIEKDLSNAEAFNTRGVAYYELKEYPGVCI